MLEHPLGAASTLIHECLSAIADEAGYLIVVSDANGMLMTIEGAAQVRLRAAGDMNFAEGTLWSEGGAGTNAIGTAIALDHAVQVFGPEHFSDPVQRWTCSAAPIHDPDTGAVIGVIDLTGDLSTVHPHSLAVATATARAVEASLQLALQERDARLHARYGDRVSPDRSALIRQRPRDRRHPFRLGRRGPARDPARRRRARAALRRRGGRRTGLPHARGLRRARRRAAARDVDLASAGQARLPRARPGDARDRRAHDRAAPAAGGDPRAAVRAPERDERQDSLCADLHGDRPGSVSSVRVEVSRLRKLLGPWIDTDRYRLTCDVETDVRRIEGLRGRQRARGRRDLRRVRCCRTPRHPASHTSASAWTPGCARP